MTASTQARRVRSRLRMETIDRALVAWWRLADWHREKSPVVVMTRRQVEAHAERHLGLGMRLEATGPGMGRELADQRRREQLRAVGS